MWGIDPNEGRATPLRLWWGARAIFRPEHRNPTIDIVHDRQAFSTYDPDTDTARAELMAWLLKKGLPALEQALDAQGVGTATRKRVKVRDRAFQVIADRKGSRGYLYIAAWKDEPFHETPSAEGGPR
jgi:hypothetical protein